MVADERPGVDRRQPAGVLSGSEPLEHANIMRLM